MSHVTHSSKSQTLPELLVERQRIPLRAIEYVLSGLIVFGVGFGLAVGF